MKNRVLKLLSIFLLFACLFSGCTNKKKVSKEVLDKAEIGLVTTVGYKYDSKIEWFDYGLNLLATDKFNYASLGSHFNSPVYQNGKVYLIPDGLGNERNGDKIISIDFSTLEVTEYPFSHSGLNHMAVIDNNVYTVNTLNDISYIERYNPDEEDSSIIEIPEVYTYAIIPLDGKLLGFNSKTLNDTMQISLNIYDKNLSLEKTIDLTPYGLTTGKYCEDDKYLYTTITYSHLDKPVSKILKINKKDYSISVLENVGFYPNDVYIYGDGLLVTNYDRVTNVGTTLSILDKEGSVKKKIDLKTDLMVTEIYKDFFIVANNNIIQTYDLKTFKLLSEKKLDTKDGYYISTIICNKK